MQQNWYPETYARFGAHVVGMARDVLQWLDPQPNEQILDLGCGEGLLTAHIGASGANVVGVDNSPAMVAAARARGITTENGRAESLPFASESFNAVFSHNALHWVRGQDAMMSEVRRVLKPGGRFVAEMGGHGNHAPIEVALMAVLARHGYQFQEEWTNYYPAPEPYARRLRQHGFHVERIALIPRPGSLSNGGVKAFLRKFRNGVLETLPESVRETVIEDIEALLAPALRDEDGNWAGAYVRLRFLART